MRRKGSPFVTPETNNANRKRNTRQPSARAVEPALPVHLALNGLAIQVFLSLNHDKVFILLCGRVPDKGEVGNVADDSRGPVLEAEVTVEPVINTVGTDCRKCPQPDHVWVSAARRGQAPCETEAAVGQEGEAQCISAG